MSGWYEISKFNREEVVKACHTALQPVLREANLTVSPYTTSVLNNTFGKKQRDGIDPKINGGQPYKYLSFFIPITVRPGRGKHLCVCVLITVLRIWHADYVKLTRNIMLAFGAYVP